MFAHKGVRFGCQITRSNSQKALRNDEFCFKNFLCKCNVVHPCLLYADSSQIQNTDILY